MVAAADSEMKIITTNGYVAFRVADHWPVLQMQTKMPVAAAVFQLPNSADEDTPDSTNLIIQLFEHGSEKERSAFATPVRQYGPVAPKAESFGGWEIYRQEAPQGDTDYSIWDAKKSGIADVSIAVRLAWPHLPNNPANYPNEMEKTFKAFLTSVWGGLGQYRPKEGEVMRRPSSGAQQGAPGDAPKAARP